MTKRTLSELTSVLQAIDDDLLPAEFEVEALVGDIRDKVDAIKWRIDSWLAHAEAIERDWLEPLTARKKALEGKAAKLKEYCAHVMSRDNCEKLPGSAFALSLRQSTSVEVTEAPTPTAAMERPDICQTKISYQWDKKAIAELLKGGNELPFAKLKSSTYVTFTTNKGIKNEPATSETK